MNSIEQLRKWCKGTWLAGEGAEIVIDELATDSRNIEHPQTALFIALTTPLRDGHSYIADAYAHGVRCFLVAHSIETTLFPSANVILVKDTLIALQQIAAAHRKQFSIPVVGITGSNGKTIVKEWL